MSEQAKTEKRWGRGLSPLAALLLATAALGLSACGSGESSTSSSVSTSPSGGSTTMPSTTPQEKPGAVKPPGKASHPASPSAQPGGSSAALRRSAGRAAPFLVPQGDNSVPTFGSEASATERSAAEAALRAYLTARAAGQWGKACSYLAAGTRKGFERLTASAGKGASCAKVLPVFAPLRAGVPANPLVGGLLSLRVKGSNAFALFYGPPKHQQYMVPMNREAGRWRPTQAAPIAYPPGAPPPTR